MLVHLDVLMVDNNHVHFAHNHRHLYDEHHDVEGRPEPICLLHRGVVDDATGHEHERSNGLIVVLEVAHSDTEDVVREDDMSVEDDDVPSLSIIDACVVGRQGGDGGRGEKERRGEEGEGVRG